MGEADEYDDFQQPTNNDQQLQEDPNKNVDQQLQEDPGKNDEVIAISEIRHEIDAILDGSHDLNTITSRQKISSIVEVNENYIFKSTLVSQLNGNLTLLKELSPEMGAQSGCLGARVHSSAGSLQGENGGAPPCFVINKETRNRIAYCK